VVIYQLKDETTLAGTLPGLPIYEGGPYSAKVDLAGDRLTMIFDSTMHPDAWQLCQRESSYDGVPGPSQALTKIVFNRNDQQAKTSAPLQSNPLNIGNKEAVYSMGQIYFHWEDIPEDEQPKIASIDHIDADTRYFQRRFVNSRSGWISSASKGQYEYSKVPQNLVESWMYHDGSDHPIEGYW